ncbi:pantoate--beta-alanine ligase [Maridesulfovibrio salexigens]|uniref:Pantothenate synthetase n=1 Tax=Maridesulfovibrio salexigens (strain ATCC 14822 / DSM 2638 / NCIMB 8403 / VKM B-1763) TaxID=526222 RepID=PANC_MARSD|nr:pantoate--beta-alanine ligase [Maridesulfovibrio salexigens]C6C1U6.1 RecName: Full=Pantothenate synthetase; Short=PS; AltName: Full=Pantoate--beta-alanine ligase; AltName: Full=Pantoate-activating enzyme [Maridesulfovibrio salexigens DSM 2638]ACS79342.1 pantoate/beta-alanine ligase [Maridesulfovibrio salexigens DSM 2638]
METISNPQELQNLCLMLRAEGKKIGLVPTMGYFHEGHLSLMDAARKQCDVLIVSLFVNPTQFGENEDLDAYPHNLERDSELAEKRGVDILFTPIRDDMYFEDHSTWVEVPDLATNLCGKSRPIHFRGVATVVTKLFMTAQPHVAVFGQKDWQQLAIIKRMVRDLNIPVDVQGHEIVREESGLALSSRNVYLTEDEKSVAPNIQKGLQKMRDWVTAGESDAAKLKSDLVEFYAETIPTGRVDYIEIVHPENINILKNVGDSALCAVAIQLGNARLIDNLLIKV